MNETDSLKKRIAELEKANRELEEIFSAMEDLIFVVDKNNVVTRVGSACASFLKTKPQNIIGKKCHEVMHNLGKPWPECPFEKTKQDKKAHAEEISDPTIGPTLLVTTSPIFNEEGEVSGAVHTAKDITEYAKLDELKSDFISTISHELRTPLSIIKEGISLVLDNVLGDVNEKQAKILGISKHNTDRLARIIDSLLEISRMGAGKVELKRGFIDISEVVRHAANSFEAEAREKGLEMRLDIDKTTGSVWADADRITQVLTNLIGNAVKFTSSGHIDISCKDKGDEVVCSVSDTGVGISKKDLPKVFNKFQQFGRTAGAGDKGTGLGLSIAKTIIDMHNGAIWAESEAGKGAGFTFELHKCTPQSIFMEYVSKAVKKAADKGARMSIIAVNSSLAGKDASGVINERFNDIMHESARLIRNTLRRESDDVVNSGGEMIVVLADCDKENAAGVQCRLEKVVSEYLADQNADGVIKVNYGRATYPDDAKGELELIEKAKAASAVSAKA